ncbi:bifunctional 2-C-methyl-D-erythritol 4-phosphate cytidylyltransferase/2-C-methyl-D-erythritol 2,4-cyclodiphosphate synthase [Kordiimonas sp. SCSIO 12610]|uniref:bifunctional 2-C-methyl-D-erythritol 4-phosphate cytidylyltransferase/2-C-methyl-D-erythritol 2,4-cyclodiphosphate synthase n=1 Tax=Kordiimonas sp. SCSIO 12610 TaxID=2829597 RepID=UPI00210B6595|nr:bifunctional 2-C-methyl-D-erythritol 4-phosphate cytidylyltransferase/2-C-methyl-D-erythritol 2,4-cyclodiphosphate synthase [Kordiimonas sp. SCSIO 12610]UTW54016.1 bifunctional 2-C-methyl-D-erythritol 4-phosphate cytidylyltransferase/2-C-methyl-D-erythritol 2,4-cyclodiphosphate synthase [Kordiimonas sp. SCSIO 12610]
MTDQLTNIGLIIVAAGSGNRAGGDVPKQYQNIAGTSILRRTIDRFLCHFETDNIRIVINSELRDLYDKCTIDLNLPEPVDGGATRQASVYNGLMSFRNNPPEYILIHDAARPFVSEAIIEDVIATLNSGASAVVPGVQIVDTLKRAQNQIIGNTVPRDNLFKVQTPQGFDYNLLLAGHETEAGKNHSDDAAIFEAMGTPVMISQGEEANFKITTPDDIQKAEKTIMSTLNDIRVGSGFDVHRFEDGDKVTLCGVDIPFNQKLKGHSDADVGMHALTDAILSAIAAGDIGTHFPPSDYRWKGEPSETFLKHAISLVRERGGMISHAGVTLICEAPKIGPHKDAMRERLATIINIDIDRVSVQATTTEKLGFTGRGEGIAAQATATVRLP